MKAFLIYIAFLLSPVLIGIVLVNYLVDPGHIYHDYYIDKVIEGARKGLNVTNVSNMNERILKKKLAELYRGQTFDYLVIGSSRVMTISEDCLNGSTLLNLGVSGSKLEDMTALYEICKENNISYKNVIIGTDPTLFNANDVDSRWKELSNHYYAFLGEKSNDDTENMKILLTNLFSLSYFQSAINYLPIMFSDNRRLKYVKTYINEGGTKRPDGSIYYAAEYRNKPLSWVDNEARTYMHHSFNNFMFFSEKRKLLFTSLVDSLKKDGVNIIIWRCPYHPLFYKRIIEMNGFLPSVDFINHFTKENGLTMIGCFDPSDLQLTNKDFYDAFHVRKETIDRLFLSSGI